MQGESGKSDEVQGGQHTASRPALALAQAQDQCREDGGESDKGGRGAGAPRPEYALAEVHSRKPDRVGNGGCLFVC